MSDTSTIEMNGAQKVAALLLSLVTVKRDLVTRILDKFDPDELSDIASAATHLGTIPPAQATRNIEDFLSRWEEGPALIGNRTQGQLFIQTAADRRLPNEPVSIEESIWDRCANIPDGILVSLISAENPQVAAFWLSRLPAPVASKVVASLPSESVSKVITLMSEMSAPRPEAIAFMEKYVAEVIDASSKSSLIGDSILIPVIANLDEYEQDRLMNSIDADNPMLAANLRKNLFKFSDIEALSLPERIALFEKVRTEDMILALSSTDPGFQDTCLQALGARMRRMVEQEILKQDAPGEKDIMKARQQIVSFALQMIQEGRIQR